MSNSASLSGATKMSVHAIDVHDFADFTLHERKNILADRKHYNGTWRMIMDRCSDPQPCLKAMGLNYFKRCAVAGHRLSHVIDLAGNTLDINAYYPLGVVKKGTFQLDGSVKLIDDDIVGNLECRMAIENGIWISKRLAKHGAVMYDNRIMYRDDPKGEVEGPLMLFRFAWKDKSGEYVINRWLKRDEPFKEDENVDLNDIVEDIESNVRPSEEDSLVNRSIADANYEVFLTPKGGDKALESSPSSPVSECLDKPATINSNNIEYFSSRMLLYSGLIVYTIAIHYYILYWK